jgi:hypothetical protein
LTVISLAAARDAAEAARALIRQSIDPIEHRVAQRATAKVEASPSVTFRAYAEGYITRMELGWKNEKHRQQWTNSRKTYAFPLIGQTPIADIDTAAVMSVLTPIWNNKPETASRVRGRLEMILTAAKAEGLRTGDNPALSRWHRSQAKEWPAARSQRGHVDDDSAATACTPKKAPFRLIAMASSKSFSEISSKSPRRTLSKSIQARRSPCSPYSASDFALRLKCKG